MAVLPWGHSRNRTTSSDKAVHPKLDWFSRSTAEPSRLALMEMMKEHSRTVSGGSGSFKGRSRPNTGASQHSQYCSATSEESGDIQSRPTSPAQSIVSAFDRSDSSRSLFSRAGAIRKKASKMSISSDSASTTGVISPQRFTSSRMGFRKREPGSRDVSFSPTKGESRQPSISKPFDFQHLSHTEQTQLDGFGKFDDAELISQFDAIQARQRSQSELRGIPTGQVSPVASPLSLMSSRRPQSPATSKVLELPITPPRPAPPPKDSPPTITIPASDVRLSRSMENFSRPTPRSPVTPAGGSPVRSRTPQPQLAPSAPIVEVHPTDLDQSPVKALPQLPPFVHAVSTQDDSARCLITAPLPSPPVAVSHIGSRPQHKRQSSSKGSLRHMSTFPSSKNPKPTLTPFDQPLYGIQEEVETISRHKSDDALSRQLYRTESQISDYAVPVDDWEGAVDYAWDHPDDMFESSGNSIKDGEFADSRAGPRESLMVIQQPAYEQVSTPTTPLMMTTGSFSSVDQSTTVPDTTSSPHTSTGYESDQRISGPSGLGLGMSLGEHAVVSQRSRPPTLEVTVPDQSLFDSPTYLPRTTYSAISKSSSQESIILSIASSILGTQRSSNSSVSPAEYANMFRTEEPLSVASAQSNLHLSAEAPKAARPESTCVPPALLQGFVGTGSTVESSKATEFKGDQKIKMNDEDSEVDELAPLPSYERHERSTSSASVHAPHRTSPISPQNSSRISRNRSSTINSYRRGARSSYSLFPNAAAPAPASSVNS